MNKAKVPWIGWLVENYELNSAQVWQSGAWCVVEEKENLAILPDLVQNISSKLTPPKLDLKTSSVEQYYRQGEPVVINDKEVYVVQSGITAFTALHSDGIEVLLGLFGPGQILLKHPEDSCHVRYTAHNDLVLTRYSWDNLTENTRFASYLHTRLLQVEAWAAMQAHPYLEQRLLGILSLLAEQFGLTQPGGEILIDLRLTHNQLASALAVNRTTVTRLLTELRRRGLISVSGIGKQERFCLHQWQIANKGHFHF